MKSKKRPWFQIHLSTALVLMFVAGVLIKINLVRYLIFGTVHQGWPWSYKWTYYVAVEIESTHYDTLWWAWLYWGLIGNVATALAILAAVAVTLEWRIRRRDARE